MFTSFRSPASERHSHSHAAVLAAGAMLLVMPAPALAATPRATPAPPAPPAPPAATAAFDPFAPAAPPLPAPPSPLRPPAPLPSAATSTSNPTQPACASKLRTPLRGRAGGGWGDGRGHTGVDILAPVGTKVRAAACGTVTFAGREGGYGTMICIRHSTRFRTCYAHLSSMAVREGSRVATQDLLGRVGMTGRTSGAHLHFETRVDGRARNPSPYLRGSRAIPGVRPATPVPAPLPTPATGGAPAAIP